MTLSSNYYRTKHRGQDRTQILELCTGFPRLRLVHLHCCRAHDARRRSPMGCDCRRKEIHGDLIGQGTGQHAKRYSKLSCCYAGLTVLLAERNRRPRSRLVQPMYFPCTFAVLFMVGIHHHLRFRLTNLRLHWGVSSASRCHGTVPRLKAPLQGTPQGYWTLECSEITFCVGSFMIRRLHFV